MSTPSSPLPSSGTTLPSPSISLTHPPPHLQQSQSQPLPPSNFIHKLLPPNHNLHHPAVPTPTNPNTATSNVPSSENPVIAELCNFLANAPRLWTSPADPPVRKFKMANGEEISCVFWKGRFFITGTDVVKILIFRFQQLGRGILNPKKFEEGVFSDLRNLKPGTEAVLEEPRSEFLEFLHKHGCIRTQKKQKVFFWHKVPHDDLFREALERNLKRVTNVFNWTQMMSSPEMVKQCMLMQAAAAASNGQVLGAPSHLMMPSPMAGMMGPTTMTTPGTTFVPWMPIMPMTTPAPNSNNFIAANSTGTVAASSLAPPTNNLPSFMMGRETHPRRTISLSAIDFTAKPTNQPTTPPIMPDIQSALSSPMFTNTSAASGLEGEDGLALEMMDSSEFIDMSPLSTEPSSPHPLNNTTTIPTRVAGKVTSSEAESPTLASSSIKRNALFSPSTLANPSTPNCSPNLLLVDDPTLPSLDLLESKGTLDGMFGNSLDPILAPVESLTSPHPPISSTSTAPMEEDSFWNKVGIEGLATEIGDPKLVAHLQQHSPLWDDLNMLMPPSVAPNLRETNL